MEKHSFSGHEPEHTMPSEADGQQGEHLTAGQLAELLGVDRRSLPDLVRSREDVNGFSIYEWVEDRDTSGRITGYIVPHDALRQLRDIPPYEAHGSAQGVAEVGLYGAHAPHRAMQTQANRPAPQPAPSAPAGMPGIAPIPPARETGMQLYPAPYTPQHAQPYPIPLQIQPQESTVDRMFEQYDRVITQKDNIIDDLRSETKRLSRELVALQMKHLNELNAMRDKLTEARLDAMNERITLQGEKKEVETELMLAEAEYGGEGGFVQQFLGEYGGELLRGVTSLSQAAMMMKGGQPTQVEGAPGTSPQSAPHEQVAPQPAQQAANLDPVSEALRQFIDLVFNGHTTSIPQLLDHAQTLEGWDAMGAAQAVMPALLGMPPAHVATVLVPVIRDRFSFVFNFEANAVVELAVSNGIVQDEAQRQQFGHLVHAIHEERKRQLDEARAENAERQSNAASTPSTETEAD